ncbi:MAG: sulfotransferase [Alphaproteobacteria bacterium]|jgi:tetratricopeptide (TPR) repeat protein
MVARSPLDEAISAWKSGDPVHAEKAARRAVRHDPDAVAALQILGACTARRGAWQDAATWFGRAAAQRPTDAGMHFNHAEALREAGDNAGAEAALRATLEADSGHVPALVTLGRMRVSAGVPIEAAALLDRAVANAPRDARARLARGEARHALGDPGAFADLREACDLAPDLAYAHFALGCALADAGDATAADASFARATDRDPALGAAHVRRGMLAMLRVDPAAALTHYNAARATGDDGARINALMAEAWRDLRRFDEARQAVDAALAHDPNDSMARLVAGQLALSGGDATAARDGFTDLIASGPAPHIAIEAETGLAQALDRLGDHRDAFRHFATANDLAARDIPDFDEKQRIPGRIAAVRDAGFAAAPAAENSDSRPSPVFLVGFPRSGTTLAEQILGAHGAFATSDEAPLIDRTLRQLDANGSDPARGLGPLTQAELAGLRRTYWQQAELTVPDLVDGRLLLDKLPWNLIELPFIARLFPDARVIVALRDPRDACLSAFMQYFRLNPATIHLLTLDDTVAIYEAIMGLWAGWRTACPLAAHELRYEALVDDFDTTVGDLLAFLDQPWRDAVRTFPERASGRIVSTPSRDAVTAPVNRSAVGRWRSYEPELVPYLDRLEVYTALFGYEGR